MPVGERGWVLRERSLVLVVDVRIASEWNVEAAFAIEPAETVVPGPIQVVEETGSLGSLRFSIFQKLVEAVAALIVLRFIILHVERNRQTPLQKIVKVNQMRVDVVQECTCGTQSKHHRKTAAKWLDETAAPRALPQRLDIRNLPTLSTRPFQRRPEP